MDLIGFNMNFVSHFQLLNYKVARTGSFKELLSFLQVKLINELIMKALKGINEDLLITLQSQFIF